MTSWGWGEDVDEVLELVDPHKRPTRKVPVVDAEAIARELDRLAKEREQQ